MKKTSTMLAASMLFFMMSCNNGSDTKKDKDSTVTQAPAKDAMIKAFSPYKSIFIKHKVKNYNEWLKGYMSGDSIRATATMTTYVIGRGVEDSNMVIVIDKITDVQKAKEFGSSPMLKEAMKKHGVISTPVISFGNVVWQDTKPSDIKTRLMVTHKVKDYNAWYKVFQSDLKARNDNGIVDRAIARDVDDSNNIRVVFVINDMAKAKSMMSSPELKRKMEEGGVVGKPDFLFYNINILKK